MHRLGLTGMAALLMVACAMGGSRDGLGGGSGSGQETTGSQSVAPNWTQPTEDAVREAAEADRREARGPDSGEIGFTFTFDGEERGTSAGVYDTQGRLIRTLWSARPYAAGTHHAIWDGRDDYGRTAPAASYTVKLLAGNVRYDWDGVIGVTEDSLAGPDNWDDTGSFPSSLAFIGSKAYVGGGYNEGRFEASVFDENSPFTVAPLNMALMSGGQFEYAASDGQRIYFGVLHYCCNGSNAVVAFTPDGRPWSFPQGVVIPQMGHQGAYFFNKHMHPQLALKDARGVDVADSRDAKITGLAVERNGNLLASAHGARGGAHLTPSLDTIYLWDKVSGEARGSITGIPNPQKMAFDLSGALWVIEGGPTADWFWNSGARLVRIRDVGGGNRIDEPIAGLDNPVDVAVNPVNGHIFVADGGRSQQVKEFDAAGGRMISALGTPGGYGKGDACDATITPTKFWLDYNGRSTGLDHPWIAIDGAGDVWVGDITANRMMRFHSGQLVAEIEMDRWNYNLSVPRNNPVRVFAGWNGMLEYQVDYGVPLAPTDSLTPGAKHSWRAVRNWYPCFLEAEAGRQDNTNARLLNTETMKNGLTIGVINYHGGPFVYKNALVSLPESGKIAFVNNRITAFRAVGFDSAGSYYHADRLGAAPNVTYTIKRNSITGFDAQGFPEWDEGTAIATYTPKLEQGNPLPACWSDGCDFAPTAGDIIPIYGGTGFNKTVGPGEAAFHLGGLPVNGTALAWQAMPEKPIRFPDGRGTYSALRNENEGNGIRSIGHDIVAGVNGNWGEFSCQFFHYRDDGLLVGQFGWRRSDLGPNSNQGLPDPYKGEPLAPGFCGNDVLFKMVEVGKDYYLYVPDEGYRAGLQRWHVSNLESIYEMTGKAALGGMATLRR